MNTDLYKTYKTNFARLTRKLNQFTSCITNSTILVIIDKTGESGFTRTLIKNIVPVVEGNDVTLNGCGVTFNYETGVFNVTNNFTLPNIFTSGTISVDDDRDIEEADSKEWNSILDDVCAVFIKK